jgi:hypothetical protein
MAKLSPRSSVYPCATCVTRRQAQKKPGRVAPLQVKRAMQRPDGSRRAKAREQPTAATEERLGIGKQRGRQGLRAPHWLLYNMPQHHVQVVGRVEEG